MSSGNIIRSRPVRVVQKKTTAKEGYDACSSVFDAKEKAKQARNRPFQGGGVGFKEHLKEFRFDDVSGYNVGDVVSVDTFSPGEKVDVTGITKGRGFTGVIKRWNQHMLRASHGAGPVHRQIGSLGANSNPSRIFKNKKMPGQYGNERVTVLNLIVVKVDKEKNLIAVKGAVPGAKNGIVFIRDSVKA